MNRSKEEYINAAKNAFSIAQMCRNLGLKCAGGNYKTVKEAIDKYEIDTSHFRGKGWNIGLKFKPNKPIPIEEILVENSNYQSNKLRKRLIEANLKEAKCDCCNRSTWNGMPIPLELHHINGDNTDNRLANLQILCPNCHAQTENYRRRKNAAMVK